MSELTIIIDTREQQPYVFSSTINTLSEKLESGDYSILGYQDKFSIERKSLDDYISSITSDRDRFFRELKRLQKYDFACIVVEGSFPELLNQKLIGDNVNINNVIGTTISIIVDQKIPVYFCTDRQHSILFCEKLITMYHKHYCNSEDIVVIKEEIKNEKGYIEGSPEKKKRGRKAKDGGEKAKARGNSKRKSSKDLL